MKKMIEELIRRNRSVRIFRQDCEISRDVLIELVDLGRLSASAANMQPLKYIVSNEAKKNEMIFSTLAWAGYLKDWAGPAEGQRPAGYIIIVHDQQICETAGCDHGIAAANILLAAVEKGLAGCMIGSINRDKLRDVLGLEDRYRIVLVLALGEPAEEVVLEDVKEDGDIKYYRDANGVHHVPKRPISEILLRY